MTKDKIIAAAREAGFNASNGFSLLIVRHSNGSWIDVSEELTTFYALAYRAGMERAAEICDTQIASGQLVDLEIHRASFIADTIRAEASRKATAHKEGG